VVTEKTFVPPFSLDLIQIRINYSTPLPITLVKFELKPSEHNKSIMIDWQTSAEINNDYFSVEQSTDAKAWLKMKDVPGAGNSTQTKEYQISTRENETTYFRLKQTDFDGFLPILIFFPTIIKHRLIK
jgi:hypothetical protein